MLENVSFEVVNKLSVVCFSVELSVVLCAEFVVSDVMDLVLDVESGNDVDSIVVWAFVTEWTVAEKVVDSLLVVSARVDPGRVVNDTVLVPVSVASIRRKRSKHDLTQTPVKSGLGLPEDETIIALCQPS